MTKPKLSDSMSIRLGLAASFVRGNKDRRALLAVQLKPHALADENWEPSPSQLKALEAEMRTIRSYKRQGL